MNMPKLPWLVRHLWLICLALGASGFLAIWLLLPRQSKIDEAWHFFIKLGIFQVICAGLAFFPNRSRHVYLLAIAPFLGMLGYILPRLSYFGYIGIPTSQPNAGDEFYTHLYVLLFPAVIAMTCFAYRLGGGSPGNVLKIGMCGTVLFISGYLDFMWFLVNPVGIPPVVQYAHHIELFLGHYPSYAETALFALCHIPILFIIILLPINRWLATLIPDTIAD